MIIVLGTNEQTFDLLRSLNYKIWFDPNFNFNSQILIFYSFCFETTDELFSTANSILANTFAKIFIKTKTTLK